MVDVKLVALQAGTFGRRFTSFFAPAHVLRRRQLGGPRRNAAAVRAPTRGGATLTAVIGLLLVRLALRAHRYVRPAMGPWLLVGRAGVLA